MYILILYIYTVYIYIYIIYITHVLCLVGWNPHIKSRCSSVSIDHRLFELFVSLFVSDGRDSVLLVLNEYSTSTQRVVLSRPIFIDKIHRTVLSRCPMLPCLPRNLLSLKCLSIQHFCPCMFGSGLKNKLESTRINWNSLHVQVISSCTTWRKWFLRNRPFDFKAGHRGHAIATNRAAHCTEDGSLRCFRIIWMQGSHCIEIWETAGLSTFHPYAKIKFSVIVLGLAFSLCFLQQNNLGFPSRLKFHRPGQHAWWPSAHLKLARVELQGELRTPKIQSDHRIICPCCHMPSMKPGFRKLHIWG